LPIQPRTTRCPYTTLFRSPEGVVSLQLDSCYFGNNNVATTIFYNPNMADSSRLLMNNCVIDSNGLSDPTLPYGHGNTAILTSSRDRKSTRLNSSHVKISYA